MTRTNHRIRKGEATVLFDGKPQLRPVMAMLSHKILRLARQLDTGRAKGKIVTSKADAEKVQPGPS